MSFVELKSIEKVHEQSITENEKSIAGVNQNYFE